jgi:hypothetical protein
MADASSSSPSWWQTLPGILTGIAAVITAATGLYIAFNRTAPRSEPTSTPSAPVSRGASVTSAADAPPHAAGRGASAPQKIELPSLNRVKLAGGDAVFTILSAQIEPLDLERRSLTLRVRFMNAGRYDAYFGSSAFRLIVDELPQAPTQLLNEVVQPDSVKEGDVIFALPVSAKDVVLQISAGDEKSRIPLKLP